MKKLIGKPWVYNSIPVVIWFLLLVLPFLSGPANLPINVRHHFIINVVTSNFLLLCIFYIHTYLIYPLFKKRGLALYIISLVAVLGLYWLYWLFFASIPPPHNNNEFKPLQEAAEQAGKHLKERGFEKRGGPRPYTAILGPLIALLCSFCYRVILDDAQRGQLIKERETIHLKTELNFLRSQISPHFMFNILNNLVSLARKKSDDLEPAIVNLSHIMRYMLYESDDNRVPLSKEIEYVKSYMDLQMLRFGSEVTLTFNITGNPDVFMIEPMLLIPFIENAFKHGTGMVEKPVIIVSLEMDENANRLKFLVVNTLSPLDVSKDGSSGIGLSNVQRRLAILYPEKHDLRVMKKDASFSIELSLQLT